VGNVNKSLVDSSFGKLTTMFVIGVQIGAWLATLHSPAAPFMNMQHFSVLFLVFESPFLVLLYTPNAMVRHVLLPRLYFLL
jgi:hypothetical protein